MADVDLTPTAEMARNAARGLELRREHGRGGTEVGVARARDISNGKGLSPETVRRMHAFFSRHAKNKAGGEDDAGYIAWMLWGGDEGRDWASRKVDALDRKERNAMSETRKAIMERLGMAATNARPGAKAKMAVAKDYDLAVTDSEYAALIAGDAVSKKIQGDSQYQITPEDRAIRERAKAAMQSAWARWDNWQKMWERATSDAERAAIEARTTDAESKMRKYRVRTSKSRASRPGAKAKMGKRYDAKIVGNELVRSDGRRYRITGRKPSLPNAREMLGEVEWLMMVGENGSEYSVQRFDDGGYRVFGGGSGMRVQWDGLVRASRPGAKVRAALADACWEGYEAVGTKPQDGKTVPNCVPKATAAKATMAAHPENIAWMRSLPAPVVAKVREILTKPHSGARAKALRDALKSGGVSYNRWIPDASAGAEVLGSQFQEAFAKPDDTEREDVKAGLKLMSASDPAVSDKIRTLIKEGKPQDQAVAIALDMKRRGEL